MLKVLVFVVRPCHNIPRCACPDAPAPADRPHMACPPSAQPPAAVVQASQVVRAMLGLDEDPDNEDLDNRPEILIRAKWTIDGCGTLEEAAKRLEAEAAWYRKLAADGWELDQEVADDYGFLHQVEADR